MANAVKDEGVDISEVYAIRHGTNKTWIRRIHRINDGDGFFVI
jgi:hypothetical protein